MNIKDAWKLSVLMEAGYVVKVHTHFVDSEVYCIIVKDKTGDAAISEDEAVSATFDSEVFRDENLLDYEVHQVSVMKPCIHWPGNMDQLHIELGRMANPDGYVEAFLEEYKKQPSLLENF